MSILRGRCSEIASSTNRILRTISKRSASGIIGGWPLVLTQELIGDNAGNQEVAFRFGLPQQIQVAYMK